MAVSFALFSGLSRSSSVPAGSLANAASVGANTVNGPLPFKVSTSPAAFSAAARVLNDPAATAVSTMSFSAGAALTATPNEDATTRAITEPTQRVFARNFIFCSPLLRVRKPTARDLQQNEHIEKI